MRSFSQTIGDFYSSAQSACVFGRMLLFLLFLVSLIDRTSSISGGLPLSITFDPAADRVRLGEPLTVRCELSSADTDSHAQSSASDSASMLLHCPIAPWDSFCFINCQSACAGEEPDKCPFQKQLGNVTCQTIVTQDGHVKYEYTIPRLTKQWVTKRNSRQAGFFCRSAGQKTPEVWLTLDKAASAVKPVPPKQNTVGDDSVVQNPSTVPPRRQAPSVQAPDTAVKPAQPSTKDEVANEPKIKTDGNILVSKSDLDAKTAAITREILVVGAIVIVFISVLLNVFCCIRCALIRQYSKTKEPVHMQHLFCMAEEIQNARLARHVRGSGADGSLLANQWDHNKSDPYRLTQSNADGSFASGSRILMGNASIALDPYHSTNTGPGSVMHGSDIITRSSCGPHGMLIPGAFSDSNSNTTVGVDVHSRYLPDGRVATHQSGSAFSLVTNAGAGAGGSDGRTKTPSAVMFPGQQFVQVWSGPSGQKHLVTSVPTGYYIQPNQVELAGSQAMSSDGLGSCLGSLGQPDNSVLETYQPSSSGISTLRRNSSSNKEPLLGPPEAGNHSPQSSRQASQQQQQQQQQSPIQPQPQKQQIQVSQKLITGQFIPTHPDTVLVLNRSQPMGSSQPQLASNLLMTKLNNSNSNPQIVHNISPLYTLVGASISQSDSGTGSGSGPLHSGDSQSGAAAVPAESKLPINLNGTLGPMSNGLRDCDQGMKMCSRNRSSSSIHMYPYPSYRRRRMHAVNSYERRRSRLKRRHDVEGSTEDDVSDWSESVIERNSKREGFLFTRHLSYDAQSPSDYVTVDLTNGGENLDVPAQHC